MVPVLDQESCYSLPCQHKIPIDPQPLYFIRFLLVYMLKARLFTGPNLFLGIHQRIYNSYWSGPPPPPHPPGILLCGSSRKMVHDNLFFVGIDGQSTVVIPYN